MTMEKKQRRNSVDQSHTSGDPEEEEKGRTMIDSNAIDHKGKFKPNKRRVKIFGKYVYIDPSERAINRDGWFNIVRLPRTVIFTTQPSCVNIEPSYGI